MTWLPIVSSEIGTSHQQTGKPCQDAGISKALNDNHIIIGAVSDGMGSALYSDIASKCAVQFVASKLASVDWSPQEGDQKGIKKIFEKTVKAVSDEIWKKAEAMQASINDFDCTLLAFVATPYWLAAIQVGDGAIVIRLKDNNYQLLFQPSKGEFANETDSLTSPLTSRNLQFCFTRGQTEFICAATDGIENISLDKTNFKEWKPYIKFFAPLEEYLLSNTDLEQKKDGIDEFLKSAKINSYTTDDKTLLLCIYQSTSKNQDLDHSSSFGENGFQSSNQLTYRHKLQLPPENASYQEVILKSTKQLSNIKNQDIEQYINSLIQDEAVEKYICLEKVLEDSVFIEIILREKKIISRRELNKKIPRLAKIIKKEIKKATGKEVRLTLWFAKEKNSSELIFRIEKIANYCKAFFKKNQHFIFEIGLIVFEIGLIVFAIELIFFVILVIYIFTIK